VIGDSWQNARIGERSQDRCRSCQRRLDAARPSPVNPATHAVMEQWSCRRAPCGAAWTRPGEYALDLVIDGIPSGTYKFTLK